MRLRSAVISGPENEKWRSADAEVNGTKNNFAVTMRRRGKFGATGRLAVCSEQVTATAKLAAQGLQWKVGSGKFQICWQFSKS
jgi:hypothetical protein